MDTPTQETYGSLEDAYNYFNKHLFESRLPTCLITLQRKGKRTYGFFSARRFNDESAELDELAMNPVHFADRDLKNTLSTLAHEMTHVEQEHFGKPGRRGYHNKEWAKLMKKIGLYPSNTGQPGGKETGQQMTHFILPGQPFDVYAERLIESGFRLRWAEGDPKAKDTEGQEPEGEGGKTGKSNRAKYKCPSCPAQAWGKPKLALICGRCRVDMVRR